MLDQGHHPARHEPGCPHRASCAGHLGDLDKPAPVSDLHPAPGLRGRYLIGAGSLTRIDHDLNPVTLHGDLPSFEPNFESLPRQCAQENSPHPPVPGCRAERNGVKALILLVVVVPLRSFDA
jgi:hypothetical protein